MPSAAIGGDIISNGLHSPAKNAHSSFCPLHSSRFTILYVLPAAFSGEKMREKHKGNGSACLARRNLPKKRYFSKKVLFFGLSRVILNLNIRSRESAMTTDVALRELPRLVCHIWLGPDPGQSVQPSRAGGYVPSLSGRGRSPFASVVYIERNASI